MKSPSESSTVAGMSDLVELGRGQFGVVYRAVREDETYAVKILQRKVKGDDDEDLRQFFREAAALSRIRHPNVCQIWDVGISNGYPYLVTDFLSGGSLAGRIATQPLTQREVIRIGRSMAMALDAVHRLGLVHRDIKPANILFDERGEPKLVDFGLATERSDAERAGVAGTLQYAAPEQMGSQGRAFDGRADLYALGIVLFECATQCLPYTQTETSELIRAHIAAAIPDVRERNSAISPALAKIIAKLMSKSPEERYSSGSALDADFDRIDELDRQWAEKQDIRLGSVTESVLGEQDLPLVGREVEFDRLKSFYQQTRAKKGAMLLVEGLPGAGKSRLVRELLRHAHQQGSMVLVGKCSSDAARPYEPLRAAIEDFAATVSRLPEEEQRALRDRLGQRTQSSAGILRSFSPRMSELLPESSGVDFGGAQEQFLEILADFFLSLADVVPGLVLCVEDIQHLDPSSFQVIVRISNGLRNRSMLVLATSRNNEESQVSLKRFIRESEVRFWQELRVGPLDVAATRVFVSEYLGGAQISDELTQWARERSEGNPFTLRVLIQAALEKGALRYSWGQFSFEREHLRSLNLPSEVFQLLLERMKGLGSSTVQLLNTAALIGPQFDSQLLTRVAQVAPSEVQTALSEATRAGLIEASGGGAFRFVHDRIRDALQSQRSSEESAHWHQRIGEALDAPDLISSNVDTLFDVARHYKNGTPESNVQRAQEVAMAAGLAAAARFADEQAFEYLSFSSQLATKHDQSLPPAVLESYAEICLRTGRLGQSRNAYEWLRDRAPSPLCRARARGALVRIRSYEQFESAEAIAGISAAFEEMGMASPKNGFSQWAGTLKDWFVSTRLNPTKAKAVELDAIERERIETLLSLYDFAGVVGFFASEDAMLIQSWLRSLKLALAKGPTRDLVKALGTYAVILGLLRNEKARAKHISFALQIADRLGDPLAIAAAHRNDIISLSMGGRSPRTVLERTRDVLLSYQNWYDAWEFESLCSIYNMFAVVSGDGKGALQWSAAAVSRLEQNALAQKDKLVISFSHAHSACALALLGRSHDTKEQLRLVQQMFAERDDVPAYHRSFITTKAAFANLWIRQRTEAKALLSSQGPRIKLIRSNPVLRDYFIADAMVRLDEALLMERRGESPDLVGLDRSVKEVERLAKDQLFAPYGALFRAAHLRLSRQFEKSRQLLVQSEQLATNLNLPLVLFEVNHQNALLFRDLKDEVASHRAARAALIMAREQSWTGFGAELVEQFPKATEGLGAGDGVQLSMVMNAGSGSKSSNRKKLDALLRVALAATNTEHIDAQIQTAIAATIQVLGADRAFLFLSTPEGSLNQATGRDHQGTVLSTITQYSASVVRRVQESRTAVVLSGTDEGEILASQSAAAHGLKSIMAAPLVFKEELVGVLYVDTRVTKGLFNLEDLELFAAIANQIAISIEMGRAARRQVEHIRVLNQLAISSTVQAMLLPNPKHESGRVEVASQYRPADVTGGDWWFCEPLPHGGMRVCLGDVTGHGIGAAMVTAAVASCFHTVRRLLPDAPPSRYFEAVHSALKDVTGGRYCMTFMLLDIFPEQGLLHWYNSASPPMLRRNRDGTIEAVNTRPTTLLGGQAPLSIDSGSLKVAPGDILFLASDGATDISYKTGRPVGLRGLMKMMMNVQMPEPKTVVENVLTQLQTVLGSRSPDDDITLIAVKVLESAGVRS